MKSLLSQRFRGYIPVVIDVETGGFNPKSDALLEIAACRIEMDETGLLVPCEVESYHVLPFKGANIDPAAIKFNKIDPYHPFRFAIQEHEALEKIFHSIKQAMKTHKAHRALLVGHNPWFDLSFVQAAAQRCQLKHPFHSFTSLDTATLSALAYGHTVLAQALQLADLGYNPNEAHSALYDTEQTAKLFCKIFNQWKLLGGWPLNQDATAKSSS